MPFSPVLERYPTVRRLLRVRRNPIVAYSAAVGLVVAATLLRLPIGAAIGEAPFITYYPAIVIATLVAGFGPGLLAAVLSGVAAWHFFLPVAEFEHSVILMLAFILVSGTNLVVVTLLNTAVEHVMAQEENLRVLIESSPTGIVVVDDDGKINLVNASTEKLFGYNRAELLGRRIEELVPEDRAAQHRKVCADFFKRPEARPMGAGIDLSGRRKDGSVFPVEVALNPVRRHGRSGVLATVIDITDRKTARDSQQLIIRELQHRTQNLFAVFQGLAYQSLREGRTLEDAKAILDGRLHALSEAYKALAGSGWEGAPLAEIIGRQFAGFSERMTVTGCDIVVAPSAAQQFALIIHELSTNALKYGALSSVDGHVLVEGQVKRNGDDVFSLVWREVGGPPVSEPTRKGFGSVILLNSVRHLARSVAMNFDPRGLTYEVHFDLSAIEMPRPAAATARVVQSQESQVLSA